MLFTQPLLYGTTMRFVEAGQQRPETDQEKDRDE
jgi:hypothetical protein